MADSSEEKTDYANFSRPRLIQMAFEAIGNDDREEASRAFGAAIRKAKRSKLWDVEAEFQKFVLLYVNGEYNEAVNRCVEALDGAKLMADVAADDEVSLPKDVVIHTLEECLGRTMSMRQDSFFRLVNHYWKAPAGEYYIAKRGRPLLTAIATAWRIQNSFALKITFELLKNELQMYTRYLQSRMEKPDEEEDEEESEGSIGRAAAPKPDDSSPSRKEPMTDEEREVLSFLEEGVQKGLLQLSDAAIERVKHIGATTTRPSHIGAIARLIEIMGPKSRESYLEALSKNTELVENQLTLTDQDAVSLRNEVVEFVERKKAEDESEGLRLQ